MISLKAQVNSGVEYVIPMVPVQSRGWFGVNSGSWSAVSIQQAITADEPQSWCPVRAKVAAPIAPPYSPKSAPVLDGHVESVDDEIGVLVAVDRPAHDFLDHRDITCSGQCYLTPTGGAMPGEGVVT